MDAHSESDSESVNLVSGCPSLEGERAAGAISKPDKPKCFTALAVEVQSRVVDFLDLISIDRLRATCNSLRALPTQRQRQVALMEFDQEMKSAHELFKDLPKTEREEISRDHWATGWNRICNTICPPRAPEKVTGKYEEWKSLAREHDISGFHALQALSEGPMAVHCFECLRRKTEEDFDITQLGPAFGASRGSDDNNQEWSGWDWRMGKESKHFCVECRLASTEATKAAVGWLRCKSNAYHIRCSHREQEDHFTKSMFWADDKFDDEEDYDYYTPYGAMPAAPNYHHARQDDFVCRRMLEGTLCRTCFRDEERYWFAYKDRLLAEIGARIEYLNWMDDKDHRLRLRPVPTNCIVEEVF